MIPEPYRVDFAAMIRELRTEGHFYYETIGVRIGTSHTQVRNYEDGQQPRHAVGERLIELWCLVFERTRAELPMTSGLPAEL